MNPSSQFPYPVQPQYVQPRPRQGWLARLKALPGWLVLLGTAGLGGVLFTLFLGISAFLSFMYFQTFDLIVPGVQVGETRLGNQRVEDAAAALNTDWNLERSIHLEDGLHTWDVPPARIGIRVDPLATARQAFGVAHGQALLAEVGQMVTAMSSGWQVAPVVEFDEALARQGLEALAAEVTQPAVDATIRIQDGQPVAVPSQIGYTLDVENALRELSAQPATPLLSAYWRLPLMPLLPRVDDVTPALDRARALLDHPLVLQAYDPVRDEYVEWPVPRDVIAGWLVVEPGEGGPLIRLDQTGLETYLANQGGNLGAERYVDAAEYAGQISASFDGGQMPVMRIFHHPTSYVVQPGDTLISIGWDLEVPFWMILQANPGMDPDNLFAGESITIPSKDDLLPLPVVPGKRVVISISQQRMWIYYNGELLHKFKISTGVDRSPTQPGVFQVQTHDPRAYASLWELTMPNFLGIYEAWPGFMNGIHALPILKNGTRLWGSILGKPASYGCIILDTPNASWLYDWAENGVIVEIEP